MSKRLTVNKRFKRIIRCCCRMAWVAVLLLFISCSSTKHVPKGKYLVNKVHINVLDNNTVNEKQLKNFLRQTPNHEIFGGLKFQLAFYNMSGKDSTKWYNKWIRRLGQAPVIYDSTLTTASANQLKLALINKGYLEAEVSVDTVVNSKRNKIVVNYNILTKQPHYINSISYNIPNDSLNKLIMQDSLQFLLHNNDLFDRTKLDEERQAITERLRKKGYFGFNKEYITYTADTTANSKACLLYTSPSPRDCS